jgi:hypothetical protein
VSTIATLPVSGLSVWAREPVGADEVLVYESDRAPVGAMLALVGRLVTAGDGTPLHWSELPAVDLAAAVLLVRRAWLGRTIQTEARCTAAGCGEPIDVAFSIDTYLEHRRPRAFRGLRAVEPPWFGLEGADVRFRVPTVADLAAAPDRASLVGLCVQPPQVAGAVLRRVERALDALAPSFDGVLEGLCPVCGAEVELWFAPIEYVLQELRDASASLFAQVHELALAYHWSEPEILGLDRRRRHGYVELVRADLVA